MKKLPPLMIMIFSCSLFAMDLPQISPTTPQESGLSGLDEKSHLFREVAPGVYAGQIQVGQEIVYFGMEKIDQENQDNWGKYSRHAESLGNTRAGGLLGNFAFFRAKNQEIPFSESIQKVTGFTEDEFNAYLSKIDNAIHNNKNIVAAIKGVASGVAGLSITADGHSYVVYASKRPVKGRFPFPSDIPRSVPLKQYYDYYGNLLMSVGSTDDPSGNTYENRGIFKNPISFIEDGNKYPGLSIKLHGFSAVVASHIFKNKQYMMVRPIPSMTRVLLGTKGWQRGDVLIDDKDLMDYTPDELEEVKTRMGMLMIDGGEPKFLIKTDALIRQYKGD